MYTDRSRMIEYEYDGVFYLREHVIPSDGNLLAEGNDKEVIIHKTKCDIQKTDKLFNSSVVSMGYNIYFPMPTNESGEDKLPKGLKIGIRFRGDICGLEVDGMVIGIEPTKLHGCVAYIKGTDI